MSLILQNHHAGFFSTSTLILFQIMNYYKTYGINVKNINSCHVFSWYNYDNNTNIFYDFFKIENIERLNNISLIEFDYEIRGDLQFKKYIDYKLDSYFNYVDVYFNLSEKVMKIYNEIISKYNIDFENLCCLFLRGNDKATECAIPSYNKYITLGNELLKSDPNIKFLIQSDEREFIEEMSLHFPNNIVFHDEIRVISKNKNLTVDNKGSTPKNNYEYALNFLAIVYIISKCKYVICNSGNISFWILMYRKGFKNYFQL